MQVESAEFIIRMRIVQLEMLEMPCRVQELLFIVFRRHFLDLGEVESPRRRQCIFSGVVKHDALIDDIRIEIPSFRQCVIQFGNAFADDLDFSDFSLLLACGEFVPNMRFNRSFASPQSSFCHDEEVVIAVKLDQPSAIILMYVMTRIGILGVAAVKNNHHDIFHLFANQTYQLLQFSLDVLGQKIYRVLHIDKFTKIFQKIGGNRHAISILFVYLFW